MKLAFQEDYLEWQHRLQTNSSFKRWWQFWSNYSWLCLLPVIVYFASYLQDAKLISKIAVAFIIARLLLKPIVSFFFPTPRPYQAFNFQPLTSMFLSMETKASNSFPSSHVISIAAASGAMLLTKPIFAILFLVIGVFTGLGRVVLGFHYPKDVIFSLVSGLIIGIIVSILI